MQGVTTELHFGSTLPSSRNPNLLVVKVREDDEELRPWHYKYESNGNPKNLRVAEIAHFRQLRPDSDLGLQAKVLKPKTGHSM